MIDAKDFSEIVRNFKQSIDCSDEYRMRNGDIEKIGFSEFRLVEDWYHWCREHGRAGFVLQRDLEQVALNSGADFKECMRILRRNVVGRLNLNDHVAVLKRLKTMSFSFAPRHFEANSGQGVMF